MTGNGTSYCTDAWVLPKGKKTRTRVPQNAALERGTYQFDILADDDVLVEPIYGCWEGNMTHALQRRPVDVCRFRREDQVVLGNSGVARVLSSGKDIKGLREGDVCMIFGNAQPDNAGYMVKALAYDAPNTMGMLAKRSKVKAHNLIKLPQNTKFSLRQWAAFSLRYVTAWSNWRVAWTVYRAHMSEQDNPSPLIAGWGGGVSFAQLQLALHFNCDTLMFASTDERIQELRDAGITPVDRRAFPDLHFEATRYANDLEFKKLYIQSEKKMLHALRETSGRDAADIFFDHIGGPLFNATLKAVGRQGVIASAGWKLGADITEFSRSTECTQRRTHVNTHYAKYSEGVDAVNYAEENNWMPPDNSPVFQWDDIPTLAEQYESNTISSYFPIYQINPE